MSRLVLWLVQPRVLLILVQFDCFMHTISCWLSIARWAMLLYAAFVRRDPKSWHKHGSGAQLIKIIGGNSVSTF